MADTYLALRVNQRGSLDELHIESLQFPELKEEEVLVKMEYSTINPSDYANVLGRYPGIAFPTTPGFEGSGTVIKSGGGEHADSLLNKKVTVVYIGTWAEYCKAPSCNVFPLLPTVSLEQAASLNVNPLTIALFIEKISQQKSKSFVQNAAASSLGKQLIKWSNRLGFKSINLVRRQEQVDLLRSIGAEYVFNTSEDGWKNQAKIVSREIGATCGFDAIAGSETNDLAQILENGGVVYNYGRLSGKNAEVGPEALMFEGKRIEGLWVLSWLERKNSKEKYETSLRIQENIDIFEKEYSKVITLEEVKDAIEPYMKNATNNKILIKIGRD
ncbi:hypothetical protein SteCoe_27826 [Stentor coeruleus]|uniref:Enoyl reductase (ER) domain-containing protein n=1 Tax=Stentor coeruleus TaxID=5963 RepID=A0A1R2B9J4_9CILI|nr:hypothetical protein SteCoe_27826 [Stentor coeruleus]